MGVVNWGLNGGGGKLGVGGSKLEGGGENSE